MNEIARRQMMNSFMEMIDHIADKEYQRMAWIQGKAADFDETVCLLSDIGDPILKKYKEFGISESQYQILQGFRNSFSNFADENDWPPEFIDSPKWGKITLMAKDVLKAFDYKKGSE